LPKHGGHSKRCHRIDPSPWFSVCRILVGDRSRTQVSPEERHFKLGYALLFLAVIALGVFGIVLPLRAAALRLPLEPFIYIGLGAALVGVIGYMLTEFGHYRVFQVPKYVTGSELFFFVVTLLIMFAAFIASADAMLGGAIRTLVKG
jgi:hypothetical protein